MAGDHVRPLPNSRAIPTDNDLLRQQELRADHRRECIFLTKVRVAVLNTLLRCPGRCAFGRVYGQEIRISSVN